jgi:hypothetical protein
MQMDAQILSAYAKIVTLNSIIRSRIFVEVRQLVIRNRRIGPVARYFIGIRILNHIIRRGLDSEVSIDSYRIKSAEGSNSLRHLRLKGILSRAHELSKIS